MSGEAGGKTGDAWSRMGTELTLSNTLACFSKSPAVAWESAEKRAAGPPTVACDTVARRRLKSRATRAVVPSQRRLEVCELCVLRF